MLRIFMSLKTVFVPNVGTLVRRSRQMDGGAMIVEYTWPGRRANGDAGGHTPTDAMMKATALSSECRS